MVTEKRHKFGTIIRSRRQDLGITQSEVAKSVGVSSPEFIGMVEAGTRSIDLDRVPPLADALGLSRKDLVRAVLYEEHPVAYKEIYGRGAPGTVKDTKDKVEAVELDPVKADLLAKLESLPKDTQTTVYNLVDQLYKAHNRKPR